jgi:hypothetical protein
MLKKRWVWFYIILVSLGLYLAFSHWAYDDPFITYRYARNIATGMGFVYNQGERVLSTTTPLFAILLAWVYKIGLSIPITANAISAVSIAAGGALIWDLSKSWKSAWVGWAGLLLYPTFPQLVRSIGSETPLYLAFCLAVFALYARSNLGWAAILAALAVLTRADGVLVVVILGAHFLWQKRQSLKYKEFWKCLPWKRIALAISLLLGWHLFAWIYFGSPVPVTLTVKQAQGLMSISTLFAPGVKEVASWYSTRWQYWAEIVLVFFGILFAFKRDRNWLLLLGWGGLYFLAFSLLSVTSYPWYYAPLVPSWVASVGLGAALVVAIPLPSLVGTSTEWGRFRKGIVIFLLVLLSFSQAFHLGLVRQNSDFRFPIYKAAGIWLRENTTEDAVVATLEVGITGYFAQRTMIDFAGLIQPEVAEIFNYDRHYEAAAIWASENYRPDYLLIFDGQFPDLRNRYLPKACELVRNLEGETYNYPTDLQIFKCY